MHALATGAACLRCRGLLAAARGDPDGAFAVYTDAIDAYESVPTPFERGRTYLALGRLQRRLKRRHAAHDSLGSALAIFETLGARLWVRQSLNELAQLGGRRTQDGNLTTTESRIAMLVAQGSTNRQVADALFLSPKTVEWNLSKIYRKLHVRSRTELAAKLARSAGDQSLSIPGEPLELRWQRSSMADDPSHLRRGLPIRHWIVVTSLIAVAIGASYAAPARATTGSG